MKIRAKHLLILLILIAIVFTMTACGADKPADTPEDTTEDVTPVVAVGLPEYTVHGETDLPGNFYLA